MHAYVLISVDLSKREQVFDALDQLVTLAEDTEPGTDWHITANIHKTFRYQIDSIHRKIRKIDGVLETALAFEKPTTQKKRKQ